MKQFLKENFGGLGSFAEIFDHGRKTSKKQDKEDQKVYDKTNVIEIEATDADTFVTVGGVSAVESSAMSTNLDEQRAQVEEYMAMAETPEVDEAVDNIINDMVSVNDDEDAVSVNLEKVEGVSEATKEKIREEFRYIVGIMKFNEMAYDRCRDWYVTGRQAFQVIVNPKRPSLGILKLVMLDSRSIRKIKDVKQEKGADGVMSIKSVEEFFVYDPNVVSENQGSSRTFQSIKQRAKLSSDSVIYVDSGRKRLKNGLVPSYLHKAIKVLNSLVNVEDATVIYAITRAPEKRAFYLDVGSLAPKSAIAYLSQMESRFKTKLTFNQTNGKVEGEAASLGIVQDYWLPRKDGMNATEIGSVEGGSALSQMMEPVHYQLQKLYRALNLPKGRIEDGGGSVNFGGSDLGEITREEYRFGKFVGRLKRRYSSIFKQALKLQLILKNITTEDDWNEKIEHYISFDYSADNYIKEQQEVATLQDRYNALATIEPYVGNLISRDTVMRDILKMSDEQIKDEAKKIADEQKAGLYGIATETDEFGEITEKVTPALKRNDGGEDDRTQNPLKFSNDDF